nr:hypothetical protein [Pseudomonas sp. GM78]
MAAALKTTFQWEEPMKSVEGNWSDARKSAVFLSLLDLDARRLWGLGGLLGFGGHLDLVLFVRGGSCGILRDEGLRLFSHGEWRQKKRRQNESAGNTHTVGHHLNLLAWQVLFGAGKDKGLGGKEKERIHERTVTQRAKIELPTQRAGKIFCRSQACRRRRPDSWS